MVEILNGRVMWPTHYDCPPTNIELLLDSSVQLLLENRVHRGFLEDALDKDPAETYDELPLPSA